MDWGCSVRLIGFRVGSPTAPMSRLSRNEGHDSEMVLAGAPRGRPGATVSGNGLGWSAVATLPGAPVWEIRAGPEADALPGGRPAFLTDGGATFP